MYLRATNSAQHYLHCTQTTYQRPHTHSSTTLYAALSPTRRTFKVLSGTSLTNLTPSRDRSINGVPRLTLKKVLVLNPRNLPPYDNIYLNKLQPSLQITHSGTDQSATTGGKVHRKPRDTFSQQEKALRKRSGTISQGERAWRKLRRAVSNRTTSKVVGVDCNYTVYCDNKK